MRARHSPSLPSFLLPSVSQSVVLLGLGVSEGKSEIVLVPAPPTTLHAHRCTGREIDIGTCYMYVGLVKAAPILTSLGKFFSNIIRR